MSHPDNYVDGLLVRIAELEAKNSNLQTAVLEWVTRIAELEDALGRARLLLSKMDASIRPAVLAEREKCLNECHDWLHGHDIATAIRARPAP